MEAGEYPTNVLSINDLSSIHFHYLEPSVPRSPAISSCIRSIESIWRSEGALVISDPSKAGIWLFGIKTDGGADALLPASAAVTVTGTIEAQGITLVTKIKGTYDPFSSAKNKAALIAKSSSQNAAQQAAQQVAQQTSQSAESPFRLMQNQTRTPQMSPPTPTQDPPPTPSIYKAETAPLDPSPAALPREMHERFLAAVLVGLLYRLCAEHGYTGLNSRTLLAPAREDPTTAIPMSPSCRLGSSMSRTIVTLDVHLTSLSNLILKASTRTTTNLISVAEIHKDEGTLNSLMEGKPVWLSPGGVLGRYIGPEGLLGQISTGTETPTSGESRPRLPSRSALEAWKGYCRDWLSLHGVNMNDQTGGWILVHIPGQQSSSTSTEVASSIIAWPARLSFCRRAAGSSHPDNTTINVCNSSTTVNHEDPLYFAEEWFNESSGRDTTIKKRQKDREAAEAAEAAAKERVETDARNAVANASSPVTLRRPSIAGGVYPTPPDGILNPVGATPNFDSSVATPGNPNLPPVNPDPGHPSMPKEESNDHDADLWGPPTTKSDAAAGDNEEVFPDLNGDLFGDAAVTDDDFNFFDEVDDPGSTMPPPAIEVVPDDVPLSHDTTRSELSRMDLSEPEKEPETNKLTVDAMDISMPPSNVPTVSAMDISKPSSEHAKDHAEEQPVAAPSPLSPETLRKKLFSGTPSHIEDGMDIDGLGSSSRRKLSAFDPVSFNSSLKSINERYGSKGKYGFELPRKTNKRPADISIPQTEYLHRRLNRKSELKLPLKYPQSGTDDDDDDASQSDAESEASFRDVQFSDPDDTSQAADSLRPPRSAGLKRRRADDGEDSASYSVQEFALDHSKSDLPEFSPTSPLFNVDPAEWSLAEILARSEPPSVSLALSPSDFVTTAQILTEQAISTTIKIPGAQEDPQPEPVKVDTAVHQIHNDFMTVAKAYINDIARCQLTTYLEIQDLWSQLSRLKARMMSNPSRPLDARPITLLPIPSPHLQVRRADSKLTVLPPAIPFWENLGLAASKGAKDVKSVCLYFDSEGMAASVSIFLDRVQSSFESCRLGSHSRLSIPGLVSGLMPIDTSSAVQASVLGRQLVLSATTDAAARLAATLSSASLADTNVVVYFVYPSNDGELLVHICHAFQHLFEVYKAALREKKQKPTVELVPQLVPLDFVASRVSLVVPDPSQYTNFAMQVYDRCTDFTVGSAPAIVLEEPPPRSIEFKLTPNPSASLIHENSCMHVAYAQSIDDRWVSASWTDNTGRLQTNASYCLGRKNGPVVTSLADVAQEIWDTTIGIISSQKVTWRILITKVGVMERAELEFWKQLAIHETNAQVNLFLITVNTRPSLNLIPSPAALPPGAFSSQTGAYTTPVSTPQGNQSSLMSPDQSGNAGTPTPTPTPTSAQPGPANAPTPGDGPTELEADATLVDLTDMTWAAILSHRLNNSNSLLEFCPALVSGYLIKRTGASPDDVPAVMEVNVVYTERGLATHDMLLREILLYFRGLNTLARVRNLVHPQRDVRPWHIAAVEKAVETLYLLM